MAEEFIRIGRVAPYYRGIWSASAAYARLDLVGNADRTAAYIARRDVPAGTPLSDGEYWGAVLDVSDVLMAVSPRPLTMTAEGNPAQVWPDEGSLLRPVAAFTPRQPGGTPWVGGAGKNLLPPPNAATQNGVTITPLSDGGVRITGTCTLSAGSANVFNIPAIGGELTGSYVLSAGNAQAVGDHLQLRLLDDAGAIAGDANFSVSSADAWKAFTYATARTIAQYAIRTGGGETYDTVIYPQLEAGAAKTDFAPYEHISPVAGRTELGLTRSGKNLLSFPDGTRDSGGVAATVSGGRISAAGTAELTYSNITYYTPAGVKAGKSWAVSIDRALEHDIVFRFSAEKDDVIFKDVYVRAGSQSAVFTADRDYAWCRLWIAALTAGDKVSIDGLGVQLEPGSAATDYEDYRGDVFALAFGQTVYGGALDWNAGVLTVDMRARTLTGDEDWKAAGTEFETCVAFNLPGTDKYGDNVWTTVLSNLFRSLSASEYSSELDGVGGYGATLTIKISRSALGGVTGTNSDAVHAFKSFLADRYAAGTPVQVCYKLASPAAIQLTPTQVAALAGLNTLQTDGDGLTLTYNKSLARDREELIARIAALERAIIDA